MFFLTYCVLIWMSRSIYYIYNILKSMWWVNQSIYLFLIAQEYKDPYRRCVSTISGPIKITISALDHYMVYCLHYMQTTMLFENIYLKYSWNLTFLLFCVFNKYYHPENMNTFLLNRYKIIHYYIIFYWTLYFRNKYIL